MRRKCYLFMLALSISLIFTVGCAPQKSIVRENRVEPKAEAAVEQMSEARVAPAAAAEQVATAQDEGADQAAARVEAMGKTAEEKLAEEKATLEKAEAEQAEAEKVEAKKAAAEKAEAEKVAAEKAAAEKAEAEKVAAEKAAAEKAEAEKVAAEKAAAEKAEAEKVAAEKAAAEKAAAENALYELKDIRFDFDKSDLKDEARETLKAHGEWLTKNKDVKVVVEGHCDERGTAEYNLALGERRAKAAAKFLLDVGIDGEKIKTISYGEEMPLDPGHDEAAWAKNRRAHFAVPGKK